MRSKICFCYVLLWISRLLVLSQGLHLKLRRFSLILINLITLLVLHVNYGTTGIQMDMDQNGYVGPLYGAPGIQFDTYQDVDPSSGGIHSAIGPPTDHRPKTPIALALGGIWSELSATAVAGKRKGYPLLRRFNTIVAKVGDNFPAQWDLSLQLCWWGRTSTSLWQEAPNVSLRQEAPKLQSILPEPTAFEAKWPT